MVSYIKILMKFYFNLKVVTHLKSASEVSYDVINMATINIDGSLIQATVYIGIVVLNQLEFII